MARRRAIIEIEYETEFNVPITRETVERAFNAQAHVYCPRAEVLEDDLA